MARNTLNGCENTVARQTGGCKGTSCEDGEGEQRIGEQRTRYHNMRGVIGTSKLAEKKVKLPLF